MTGNEDEAPSVSEQLIRGALDLIAESGSSDLSVRRLAQAADRTTMCIYTKFSGRQGLLEAVYERAGQELIDALAAERTPDEFADRYREMVLAKPGIYEFLFEQPLPAMGLPAAARHGLVGRVIQQLAQVLQTPAQGGGLESARQGVATLHGMALLIRISPDGAEWSRWFRSAVAPAQ